MTIWNERLGALGILNFVIRSFFTKITVRYNNNTVSGICKSFLRFLKRLNLCNNFLEFDLSLTKRASDGVTLVYQLNKDINSCLEAFCRKYIPNEPANFKGMVKCYLSQHLRKRFYFATVVRREIASNDKINNEKNIIYFKRHPLNRVIIPFYLEKGFIVKESANFICYMKFIFLPLCYLLLILMNKLSLRKRIITNISQIRPSIWIEYFGGISFLDFTFWLKYIKYDNFDIVYYLDRNDTPFSKKTQIDIERKKIKWIDAHTLSLLSMTDFDWGIIKELLCGLFTFKPRYPMWYRVFRFQYQLWLFIYKFVFKHFKVKVLIQHQENLWKQGVQATAIESIGGISLGLHWSSHPSPMTPGHLFPYHVFFVWGRLIKNMIEMGEHTCSHILPSGLWITSVKNRQDGLTKFSDKVNFVISIFDTSVEFNSHHTPNDLSLFYLKIIDLIKNNHSWGGIIKSKEYSLLDDFYSLPRGRDIATGLKCLIEQKRMFILSHKISPLSVAAYADLAVCHTLNSAGIILGIHGFRAIHWDCVGWQEHPFYTDQEQQFIYKDLGALEKAILKASYGDKMIGDFSKWKKESNYFDDFNAEQRIGKFIEDFMNTIIQKEDLKISLESSVRKYIEENRIDGAFVK